jgi:hypothetical protein
MGNITKSEVILGISGHLALVAFLLAGYMSAYFKARVAPLPPEPSPWSRKRGMAICMVMLLAAVIAVYFRWSDPVFPQFIGASFNITCFTAACYA